MAHDNLAGEGQREKVELGGENFYLVATIERGIPSLTATVPHENRPDRRELRTVVETICNRANAMMARLMEAKHD